MGFSIRMNEEERARALFEKIEDEYDIRVAEEAHEAYVKSGKKRRPIEELWKETGL